MTAYCVQADVYRFVPPGALQVAGRLLSSASTSAESMTLAGHGLRDDQALLFRAESGGSLPSPLVAGTTYYARVLTPDTFQVAATPGGSAINLTSSGSNVVCVAPLQWDDWIAECSAMVEQTMVAHTVPLLNPDDSIPEPVRMYTAALLAMRALAHVGADTAAVQRPLEYWAKQVEKWGKGVPLRGTQVPAAANLAAKATRSGTDPRGWIPSGGGLP